MHFNVAVLTSFLDVIALTQKLGGTSVHHYDIRTLTDCFVAEMRHVNKNAAKCYLKTTHSFVTLQQKNVSDVSSYFSI